MLISGIGMYLLFSLLTRYAQTPSRAGYGFGLSGVLAGAALIPFSVLGFVAGRLTPRLVDRATPRRTFVLYAAAVAAAAGLYAALPNSLAATLVAMAVLGFGVGGISAIMPRLVLDGCRSQKPPACCRSIRLCGASGSAWEAPLRASSSPRRRPPVRCFRPSVATPRRRSARSRYSSSAPSSFSSAKQGAAASARPGAEVTRARHLTDGGFVGRLCLTRPQATIGCGCSGSRNNFERRRVQRLIT